MAAVACELTLKDFAAFCKRMKLENGGPAKLHSFERELLEPYFDGVTESLALLPKKNGKSTLMSLVGLHRLFVTDFANVAVVAASRDQAMVLFEQARGFYLRTQWLQDELKVLRGYREIRRRHPGSESEKDFRGLLKVYAADADTADGWLGDLALVDELHRHKSPDLYGVLRDGLGPRDGQMITISTAGETDDSPLGELRAKAYALPKMKRDGAHRWVVTPSFAMHEWALEPTDDLSDMALVKTANPAPWQTVPKLKARYESPSMTPAQWSRFAAGVWGQGGEPFFVREAWDALADQGRGIEEGRTVTMGFDGARRRDDTGLIVCDIETGHQIVAGHWRKPVDADDDWEVPEGEVDEAVDYCFERWDVWRMNADPPYWESAVDRWAGQYGLDKVFRWWTNRTKAMALALRAYRNDMRPGEMSHDGDPDFSAHIGNCITKPTRMVEDDEPLAIIRKASRDSPNKIDLAVAGTLAWDARGDAIASGDWKEPDYARARW